MAIADVFDLPLAQMIGYTTSSRFAELFKKSTGILPIEYRKLARSKH